MKPKQYITKPVHVEVVQLDGTYETAKFVEDWSNGKFEPCHYDPRNNTCQGGYIAVYSGVRVSQATDYVVKGPLGEFWFISEKIFEATYEEILS